MKTKFLLAFLAVALATSFAAAAADVPAKVDAASAEQPTKTEPAKMKVRPHSHVEAKGGIVPAVSSETKEQPKRPLHDHLKFHKQM